MILRTRLFSRKAALALGLLLPLAACASQREATSPPAGGGLEGACSAEAADFALGELYGPTLAQDAREAAGAEIVRALRPGQAVTMEYRADRLSLVLGEDGRVSDVRCG